MLSKPGGKPLFFHDTDSGTVLFAQRSGVVGIAEQAGIKGTYSNRFAY